MVNGIVIHVAAGEEKRTEFFGGERIKIGADASCDLRFEPADESAPAHDAAGVWLELRRENNSYRVAGFNENLNLQFNGTPLALFTRLADGDSIKIGVAEIVLQFFNVTKQSALTATTNGAAATNGAGGSRSMRFIEEAALESAVSHKRDDAKVFLREFVRELVNEVSWVTKLVVLVIVIAALGGLFYVGMAVSRELQRTREVIEAQSETIKNQQTELANTKNKIGELIESNGQLRDIYSLAPRLRSDYGNGVCLLVGTYDLVDKTTGKQLRYPDATMVPSPDPYEPAPTVSENGFAPAAQNAQEPKSPLTTEGTGTPVEYDFVGTGFHVGGGYILTNRHVVTPWTESEEVKIMSRLANGRARLKKLVVYFPGFPQPFPLKVRETAETEDLAVASLDPNSVFPDIPVLPLDDDSDAARVGKTVVTMGYPNGPDRLVAMVDEKDARRIQARCNGSLQTLVGCLAQEKLITPLLTQGTVTDLAAKRIVHNAQTAEGGSGAPLFGQSGRVIGVNFGVFTENAASNMAIPIKYALPMLKRAGWTSPAIGQPPVQQQTAETDKSEPKKPEINPNANGSTGKVSRN